MKAWFGSISLIVALVFANSALAQCCQKKDGEQAKATKVASGDSCCAKDKSTCPMASKDCEGKLAADMPKMKYKVGEKTVCCPQEAEKLAEGDAAKIRFVVADKDYADKTEALKAYATVLDDYLASIQNVRYAIGDKCVACPMEAESLAKTSGGAVKYRVASYTFDDQKKAELAVKAARAAIEKVEMKRVVDGKTYTCDKEAGEACKTSGKNCEYVIGETKTCCPVTAKVELAKSRILAAYQAIEKVAGA